MCKNWLCMALLSIASLSAHADWACEVVLCLANPQGPTAVAECVPPIEKLWSELAKGHGFPFCDMNTSGSSGNRASYQWATGDYCPPQYTYWGGAEGNTLLCQMRGAVTITLDGKPYNRTWWSGNATVTENLSAEASDTPGASTQFQQDYVLWKAREDAAAAPTSNGN